VVAQSVLMIACVAVGVTWPSQWHSAATFVAGILLTTLGGLLGATGWRGLGRNRTPFPKPQADSVLVETGVYGLVRHPLYASVILGGWGWALLWSSVPALIAAALMLVFFDLKARREERWLRARYAGYDAYARRVARLIPWLY
jgi:protein-S-isoprenylcysteine O-methyltransferase Ste14